MSYIFAASSPDFTTYVPVFVGVLMALGGSGGIVFGALRYNRQESGEILKQHSQILEDMRSLNDELQEALNRSRTEHELTRKERDELRIEVAGLRNKLEVLNLELRRLRSQMNMGD